MNRFYTIFRHEFSELETWREALSNGYSLLAYNDKDFGCMDAKELIPAGSSEWRLLVSKGIGNHVYGAATTWGKR